MKSALKAAVLYFLVVFGAGFALGALRVLWLVPQIGSRAAELLEMPVMATAMFFAARHLVRRLALAPALRVRLAMGFAALALMLAAEFALVLPLRGISLEQYLRTLDPVTGALYYALLGIYALLPSMMQGQRWYSLHATAWGSAALAVVILGLGYAAFAGDLERAARRVAHGSRIAATACGSIEYAEMGEGPALLLVHGAGGGFDQGIEFGGELARRGYRVIAMSRFGYLRTPLPPDATPQAQADAHACLLDALGIERAAVAGISAGAPSSLQFAIRHPGRTRALFLLVPLAYRPTEAAPGDPRESGLLGRFMLQHAVNSDFLYWLALRVAPGLVARTILGTPPGALAEASTEEQERAALMMKHIMPLRLRHAGLSNDARVAQTLAPYPLEQIAAPTLVISVADDLYGTFETAGYTASQIRGARFIGYQRGGHVALGHHDAILDELVSFLSGAASFAVAAR